MKKLILTTLLLVLSAQVFGLAKNKSRPLVKKEKTMILRQLSKMTFKNSWTNKPIKKGLKQASSAKSSNIMTFECTKRGKTILVDCLIRIGVSMDLGDGGEPDTIVFRIDAVLEDKGSLDLILISATAKLIAG